MSEQSFKISDLFSIEGKVALVTGASAGLGAATAKLFAQRGATVFGIARDAARMTEVFADVSGASFASVDISSPEACAQAVASCVEEFGQLDILANVAGFHEMRHTAEMTDQDWKTDLAVNLYGPFYLCRAALPHLLKTGGNIVNVASNAGLMGQAYTTAYCASKHGLIGMTKSLAMEFIKHDVRINVVAPAGTDTPMNVGVSFPEGVNPKLIKPYMGMRGMGAAEDVASLIAYVASDEARMIHGAVLSVDNGMMAG